MKVFTVIVTYNGMNWIDQCLKSVITQSEVVVVDNNSSDLTVNFIKQNYPSVKLLEQNINLGFGRANNIGISYALNNNAEAVFLLNQDAFAKKDTINKLITASIKNPEFGIISPIHLNGDGSAVDYSFLRFINPNNVENLNSDLILRNFSKSIYEIKFVNAAAWFIPKKVFYDVGGFDPIFFLYGEDDNYCQRLIHHGYKIGIIPSTTIFHDSLNTNYEEGFPGGEKYFRQFINSVYVKYANINAFKKEDVRKFKTYLLRKFIVNLLLLKIFKAKLFLKKYQMVDVNLISKSVKHNKEPKPSYLNV
jgi:GT2 family glycosyltransferase